MAGRTGWRFGQYGSRAQWFGMLPKTRPKDTAPSDREQVGISSYGLHKASDQAVLIIDSKDRSLGAWQGAASKYTRSWSSDSVFGEPKSRVK